MEFFKQICCTLWLVDLVYNSIVLSTAMQVMSHSLQVVCVSLQFPSGHAAFLSKWYSATQIPVCFVIVSVLHAASNYLHSLPAPPQDLELVSKHSVQVQGSCASRLLPEEAKQHGDPDHILNQHGIVQLRPSHSAICAD